MVAAILLTGCVDYNLGIRFDSPNQGEIVQHIQIGERLRNFSGTTVQQWLDSIERRSRSLGGRVQRLPNQELLVSIPFTNSADLETRFNQFFALSTQDKRQSTASVESDLASVKSHLEIVRNNLLVLERQRLCYDLDLRSLGVMSSDGTMLLSPASLLSLKFSLETPWGARSIKASNSTVVEVRRGGRQLVWQLVPGEQNHLEAMFWLPSPLGIGTVVIALVVLVGRSLKYPGKVGTIAPSISESSPMP
jgi:hypothetical protein